LDYTIKYGTLPEGYDRRTDGTGPESLCHPGAWNDIGERLVQIQRYARRPSTIPDAGLGLGVPIKEFRYYDTVGVAYTTAPTSVVITSNQELQAGQIIYYKLTLSRVPKTLWPADACCWFFVTGWLNGAPVRPQYTVSGTTHYVDVAARCVGSVEDRIPAEQQPRVGKVDAATQSWSFWVWNAYNPSQSIVESGSEGIELMLWMARLKRAIGNIR